MTFTITFKRQTQLAHWRDLTIVSTRTEQSELLFTQQQKQKKTTNEIKLKLT